MSQGGGASAASNDDDDVVRELERYKELCERLEAENARLREENAKMREELESLKTTVHAVVARSIDAKADTQEGALEAIQEVRQEGRPRWRDQS